MQRHRFEFPKAREEERERDFTVKAICEDGSGVRMYMPIGTVQDLLGRSKKASAFFIQSDTPESAVDVAAALKGHAAFKSYTVIESSKYADLLGTSKIADHRQAGALGDERPIAELQGERMLSLRDMANGLAVAANGGNGPFVRPGNQFVGHHGEQFAKFGIEVTDEIEMGGRIGDQGVDALADGVRIRLTDRPRDLEATVRVHVKHNTINAVSAGAGHQSDVAFAQGLSIA